MKIHVHTFIPNRMLIPATGTQQLWCYACCMGNCILLQTFTWKHKNIDKCII